MTFPPHLPHKLSYIGKNCTAVYREPEQPRRYNDQATVWKVRGSSLCRRKRFFSPPNRPYRPWHPLSFLRYGYQNLFL